MVDKKLPEPPENMRRCSYCGIKRGKMVGMLIHWPSSDYAKNTVTLPSGMVVEPFSIWSYICQWCRGVETKKKAEGGK